jgi:Na+-driven multidrug efflux pump
MAVNTNEKVRRKILTGNLWSVVLSVTLPLFLYQLINSVYSVVDALMLVKIDTAASSAGAILAQVKTLLSSFGSGISAGGAILIAKYYGAGDIKKAKKYANVTFAWELIIIVLSLIIFLPLAEPIMRLTGCNDELVKIAHNYFRLQIVELCIININSVFIAIQKSKGKTRIILISNIIMMAIKLGLNALLIYVFKVDDMTWIEGASVLSQLFMLILGSFYLFNKNAIFRIELKELTLDWKYSKKLLIISLPMFAGKFVISLGKVAVNSICSTFIEGDSLLVGALGISNNLSGLVTNPTVALEDSESGIVSQNLGNKNMKRTFKVMLISLCYVTIWSTIGFLLVRVLC